MSETNSLSQKLTVAFFVCVDVCWLTLLEFVGAKIGKKEDDLKKTLSKKQVNHHKTKASLSEMAQKLETWYISKSNQTEPEIEEEKISQKNL